MKRFSNQQIEYKPKGRLTDGSRLKERISAVRQGLPPQYVQSRLSGGLRWLLLGRKPVQQDCACYSKHIIVSLPQHDAKDALRCERRLRVSKRSDRSGLRIWPRRTDQVWREHQSITEWMEMLQLRVENLQPSDQQTPEAVATGQDPLFQTAAAKKYAVFRMCV